MSCIDGFVIAVRSANLKQFVRHARTFDGTFLEFGATRVRECWGDAVPDGGLTDFRRAVLARPEESVVFSWVEWPDNATHAADLRKFIKDPRMQGGSNMPFDGKRMIFGGFVPVARLAENLDQSRLFTDRPDPGLPKGKLSGTI